MILASVAASLLWLLLVPGLNYLLDPYGLFSEQHHSYKTEPNLRTLKRDFVLNQGREKGYLMFSNSKGGVYGEYGEEFYNMSYSMGTPKEFLEDISFLINQDRPIDSLVLFIDETSIYESYEAHERQALRRLYDLDDFWSLLSIPVSLQKITPILFSEKDNNIQFYLDEDGRYTWTGFPYVKNKEIKLLKVQQTVDPRSSITSAVQVWLEIHQFLKSESIPFKIYIHPLSQARVESAPYIYSDLSLLIHTLKGKGLVFANDIQVIQSTCECFYDSMHYSKKVADSVLPGIDFINSNVSR